MYASGIPHDVAMEVRAHDEPKIERDDTGKEVIRVVRPRTVTEYVNHDIRVHRVSFQDIRELEQKEKKNEKAIVLSLIGTVAASVLSALCAYAGMSAYQQPFLAVLGGELLCGFGGLSLGVWLASKVLLVHQRALTAWYDTRSIPRGTRVYYGQDSVMKADHVIVVT